MSSLPGMSTLRRLSVLATSTTSNDRNEDELLRIASDRRRSSLARPPSFNPKYTTDSFNKASLTQEPHSDSQSAASQVSERRRSSVTKQAQEDDIILSYRLSKPMSIFPHYTSDQQEKIVITPDPEVNGYSISCMRTGEHFLTINTPKTNLPGESHIRRFYGDLHDYKGVRRTAPGLEPDRQKRADEQRENNTGGQSQPDTNVFDPSTSADETEADASDIAPEDTSHPVSFSSSPQLISSNSNSKSQSSHHPETHTLRLATLQRDTLSLHPRHSLIDATNSETLMAIEISPTSSWNTNEQKANISILQAYANAGHVEPKRLKWRGVKGGVEGVLEWEGKAVAVCAREPDKVGKEGATEMGRHVIYVAPGLDLFVPAAIVMALEDRVGDRRESEGAGGGGGGGRRRRSSVLGLQR